MLSAFPFFQIFLNLGVDFDFEELSAEKNKSISDTGQGELEGPKLSVCKNLLVFIICWSSANLPHK